MRVKDSDDLSEDVRRAVAEVSQIVTNDGGTIRIKLHDKVKALELLGKHLGMFVDRKEFIVTPGADRPSREWPLEDIIRVRDQLRARAVEGEYSEALWAHLPLTVRNRILTRFWSAQGR